MSNALKYIKDLEAAGFARTQAEAQVQMVLDVLEGDLVTKGDLKGEVSVLKNEMLVLRSEMLVLRSEMNDRFNLVDLRFAEVDKRFSEFELRIVTRLGMLTISCFTIFTAILGYLIKH